MKRIAYLFISTLALSFASAQTTVTTASQLNTALSSATAGSTIILKNGIWKDLTLNVTKSGSAGKPITIKAETVGGVTFEGKFQSKIDGSYIVLDGFTIKNASSAVTIAMDVIITVGNSSYTSSNIRLTNIKFDSYNSSQADDGSSGLRYVKLQGTYHEVDHCSFVGKRNVGSSCFVQRKAGVADYHKIHDNYFGNRRPESGTYDEQNDQDAIRIGDSNASQSSSFTEVYNNLFDDWIGEIEIISNKSGECKIYNNTFNNYAGTLTLRHGKSSEVYNNFFFATSNPLYAKSGGIRVIDEGHKIYNNYIQGVRLGGSSNTGGINITNGRPNTELNGYYQVKNVQIVNNTLVDCEAGLLVGTMVKSDLTLAPENCVIANNIMVNTATTAANYNAFLIKTPLTGTSSKIEGNSREGGKWDLTANQGATNTVVTGLLSTSATNGFRRITSTSPAVNSAIGTYSFVTNDIIGGLRAGVSDRGCEEYRGNGRMLPLSLADVGFTIGQITTPITTSTEVENILNAESILLAPNPFSGQFKIQISGNAAIESVSLMNASGKEVPFSANAIAATTWEVNASELVSGIYFAKIKTDKETKIQKIVKE